MTGNVATKAPPQAAGDISGAIPLPKRIILVDESPLYAEAWRALLEDRYGGRVLFEAYRDAASVLPKLGPEVSLLMLDLDSPAVDGQRLFELAKERGVRLRRIVVLSERPAEQLHDLFPSDCCLAVINKTEPLQQSAFLMILDSIVIRH